MGHLNIGIVDFSHPFSLKENKKKVKANKGHVRGPVFFVG